MRSFTSPWHMRADPHPLSAALPTFQPPAQRLEGTVISRQLRQDLRRDHGGMAAGIAAQPNHLVSDHDIAQAGNGPMADLKWKGDEPAPR